MENYIKISENRSILKKIRDDIIVRNRIPELDMLKIVKKIRPLKNDVFKIGSKLRINNTNKIN